MHMELYMEIPERSHVQDVNAERVCTRGFPKLLVATFEIKSFTEMHLFHVTDFYVAICL